MVNVTAADVKRLRELTGAGMMDCKKSLEEAAGDVDKAVELLRLKGAKDVTKRAQRVAANGLVTADVEGTRTGVLVELNCETDFVAKNDSFQHAAADILATAVRTGVPDRLALLNAQVKPGTTVQQRIDEASAAIKEKVELGRFARLEGGYIASYLHKSDPSLPPAVGVLLQLETENAGLAKDLAQQVAAMRPSYVATEDVPADVIEKERRIAEQITRDEGKPEGAIARIVEGRLKSFLKDVVLVEQAYVKDPKKTVKQLLAEAGATVKGFARFKIGEA
ncbi:MAG TPA: translation elongation factor Ts [Streptosporangiaceae bacterium]|nr:translation elongation factor Ts [Streptosporangiaceae bacterium]